MRFEHRRMDHRVALVLARQLLLALDERLRVGRDFLAPLRPAADGVRAVHARQRVDERGERALHLALRGEIERIVTAHQHGVRADLHHRRLGNGAVHALAPDEEKQVGLEPRRLLEVGGHGVHAAVERVPVGKIDEHLARGKHRRVQELREPDGFGVRAAAPHVVAEHQHRAACGAEPSRDRLHRLAPRGSRRFDAIARAVADLRLEPLTIEQRCADGQVHGPRRRRRRLAQRAGGGDGNRLRLGHHRVRRARVLGDRAHRLGLAQPGMRCEPTIILQLRGPVAGDNQQRRARVLRVEELAGELPRAAHHVRDDDADLAAQAVIAIGHRGHEPLVLADDQAVFLGFGQRGEDSRLRGARVREEIFHARVLEGLQQQHPARARDGLAHGRHLARVV